MNGVPSSNNCNPQSITNWIDLQRTCPFDPRDLIASAILNSTPGEFDFSTDFIEPGAWSASPLSISNKPLVSALESDNQLKVADASQWNFLNLTWNNSASLAIPARKTVFLRGVHEWSNRLYLDFGENPVTDVQLSFLMNAATRGDKQGTVPVIRWTGLSLTGENTLNVVLRQFGTFSVGIWTFDGANHAMYESIWNVVR
ncbi:MAG TPA: hypothetical protein PK916_16300 [Bacteroidota bacterium]|nr:hypothetical protein [Bacteroidota bacterium]